MHEYAITKEILRISRQLAKEKGIEWVKRITIQLGKLNTYEKEPILHYFNELKIGGDYLKDAELIVEITPGDELKLVSIEEFGIDKNLKAKNDSTAKKTREDLNSQGILVVNLLGAPGAGKTTLIENLANFIGKDKLFVIQGDLKSVVDKERLEENGIRTYQINTHSGCHLNAHMVEDALRNVDLKGVEYLLIENVGNLVCPAGMLIGQNINILVSATTEGYDKPEKYPHIFRDAQLIVLSKYDLKDAVEFDEKEYFKRLGPVLEKTPIIKVSKKEKDSYERVFKWLHNFKKHNLFTQS